MFQQLWQINIISCVIQSPADYIYMAEWKFGSGDSKTKNKNNG